LNSIHNLLSVCLTGAALAACGGKPNVWLVEVDTAKGAGVVCEETLSETIIGGLYTGRDDNDTGPFDVVSSSEGSNFLFYVKIVELGDGRGSLNSGDLLLTGAETDEGWTFGWTGRSAGDTSVTHPGGYSYRSSYLEEYTTKLALKLDSTTEATGTFSVGRLNTRQQAESDEWGDEVTADLGRTGSMYWYDEGRDWVENRGTSVDCEGGTCEVTETSGCAASAPLVAHRTQLKNDDDFSALVGLAEYGSFKTTSGGGGWGGIDTGWSGGDSGW
jgi:hypothetical protein